MPLDELTTTGEMSTGEVSRRLGELGQKMDTIIQSYPKWPDVQRVEQGLKAAHDADVAALTARIDGLTSWQVWAGRSILGALIVGALGAVLTFAP